MTEATFNSSQFKPYVGVVLYNKAGDILLECPVKTGSHWNLLEFPLNDTANAALETKRILDKLLPKDSFRMRSNTKGWFCLHVPPFVLNTNMHSKKGIVGYAYQWMAVEIVDRHLFEVLPKDRAHNYKVVKFQDLPSIAAPYKRLAYKNVLKSFEQLIKDKEDVMDKWQSASRQLMIQQSA